VPLLSGAMLLLVSACGGGSAASSSTPSLAQLSALSGSDRQKTLEDGARKEGKMTFYTSGILTSATGDVIKKFEAKYPFVKVDVYRADNAEIDQRVVQEYNAKQYLVDAFETSAEGLVPLQARGILGAYNSPDLPNYIDDAKTQAPNGGGTSWVVVRESYHGIGWNTKLVKDEDVPKTHDDILNPRWKGVIAVPQVFETTVGAYLSAKGPDFVNKLADLKIRYMKVSARQLADLVISGEVPLSIDIASAHVTDSQGKGAPIAWRGLEPVPTNEGSLAIAAKPAHPYAAMLYIDFVLSKEGAAVYDSFGYGTDRSDYQGKYSLPVSTKRFYASRVPDFEQAQDQWRKLVLQITTS
jgi:iron(III) transport system substrate-binding protein